MDSLMDYDELEERRSKANGFPADSMLNRLPSLDTIRMGMMYSRRLECIWLSIEERYSEPEYHLADAAKGCGISRDYLNVLLQRFARTTFNNLLARYRIEKSLQLFGERNYTITEIYMRCGYRSAATFDRQFKKWLGCLPSEYKKLLRREMFGDSSAADK